MIDNPMARPVMGDEPDFICERCGAPLFGEDPVIEDDDKWVCEECFSEVLRRMGLADIADAMCRRAERAEDMK